MNEAEQISAVTAPAAEPQPARRSRWQRFSPSMGWPAFWSEILIVVLGVVIALAANEAVEDWNWRNKVKDAEARLQGDIAWVFLWSAEKSVTQPCVDAQLSAMSRNVLDSGDTLQPLPVGTALDRQWVVRMPTRPYRFPTWEALLADGTASHFPPQRQAILGRISHDMVQARAYEAESRGLDGALLVMRDPIALDPVVRADLLTNINRLRSLWGNERLYARQRMRLIADAGMAPSEAAVELFLNADGKQPSGSNFSGAVPDCKKQQLPLGDWRDYRDVVFTVGAPGEGQTK